MYNNNNLSSLNGLNCRVPALYLKCKSTFVKVSAASVEISNVEVYLKNSGAANKITCSNNL